ncbi:MAG: Fur family transcriptional regulator [Magnetovibrionaceae bacterium]
MTDHSHTAPQLTRNQSLVMSRLEVADGPLSAYTILDQLRDQGLKAPLQVYRALDKLVESGLVHRLESLNAFVACRHPGCDDHELVAFAICEDCGDVSELSDPDLSDRLGGLVRDQGFALRKSTVELRGRCKQCRKARPTGQDGL